MTIPHSCPFFDDDDEEALRRALRDRFVTAGVRAADFGRAAAALMGRSWGIPVQSGTDALTAALKLVGVAAGDAVALPTYMCGAALDAAHMNRAEPVLVDIRRETLALDPEKLPPDAAVAAVIAPHPYGMTADMSAITHPNLIEDCAQTLAVEADGRPVGSRGRLAVCSFYGTKLVACGHGGMLLGDDPELYAAAMDLFSHDKRDEWSPHWHFLMSDLNAALGLSQLTKLPWFIEERRRISRQYLKALTGRDDIDPPSIFRFLVVAPDADEAIAAFSQDGIEASRPVFKPLHALLGRDDTDFPETAWAHAHIVSVPIYPGMSESDVRIICEQLESRRHELSCWPPA